MARRGVPLSEPFHLWRTLVAQELAVRYRGTLLGRLWPLLLPLFMLGIYGFVFGVVFRARWPGMAGDDHFGFALNLFIGLLVHGLLAEVVGQAPALFQRNANFVRKMVFPLPVLVAVPMGTALFHASLGFGIVLLANGIFGSGLHLTVLAAPFVLLPYLMMLYGFALMVAALGVYLRDLNQVVGLLVMVALFTSTVFFPAAMVPEALVDVVRFNPVSWPAETLRNCLLHGQWPAWGAWAGYTGVACLVMVVGWRMFAVLRRGFADLL